jgi:hypothetical protein
MKLASKIIFIGLLLGITATSCKKSACQEQIPELAYLSFSIISEDSSEYRLTYSFSDCDGDLGMSPDGSIKDENGEVQTNNIFITPFYMENGVWIEKVYKEGFPGLDNKIPILGNSSANPSLDGEFDRDINLVASDLGEYDTLMFKCKILDNAGHYSEEVESPGFPIY